MNAAERLMILCLVGVALIETHDFLRMKFHQMIPVDPARDTECDRGAEQSESDNRQQAKIQHRAISF